MLAIHFIVKAFSQLYILTRQITSVLKVGVPVGSKLIKEDWLMRIF